MRTPLADNKQRKQTAVGKSIPFPVEGWDTVSPQAAMDPKRAIQMDNIIPRQAYGELRKGFAYWAYTAAASVESLMAYQAQDATQDRLFAAAGTAIYNVTNAVGTSSLTGLTNARWQHVNFATSGGHYLYIVNGADSSKHWNGTVWATPSITGATSSTFIHVNAFKRRLFFVIEDTAKFAYLPVDSIAGAVSTFDLGSVFTQGGYLMAMATWTVDGGTGVDDHAVFISSRGQIAIYKGSDPGDATDWFLVGVYNLPPPIGRRCFTKVGGDVMLVTISGVLPLSQSLILDKAAVNNVAITANISPTVNQAATLYANNYGWQLIGYPKGTIALLNVPLTEGVLSHQYVMNTISGAWCRFTGWNANCWEVFQDMLFFGTSNGYVAKADSGASDGGQPIVGDVKTAFNYFNARGVKKRYIMLRPLITSDGRVTPVVNLNVDFKDALPTSTATVNTSNAIYWDQFYWDTANWPPEEVDSSFWKGVTGIGYCAAVRLRVVASLGANDSLWDQSQWDTARWDTGTSTPVIMKINGFDISMQKGSLL